MSDPTTESTQAPSLPQHDTAWQQARRKLELTASSLVYDYEHWQGVPMPMATLSSAIAAAVDLGGSWFVGQAENLARIAVNLAIWKLLRRLGTNDKSLDATVPALSALFESPLLRHLQQDVGHVDGTFKAGEELVARIEALTASHSTSGSDQDTLGSIPDFAQVFEIFGVPDVTGRWQDDRVFASQRLAGLNPMLIQRVTTDGSVGVAWPTLRALLSSKITDATVSYFLPGVTLDDAVKQGRLFVCDYAALGHITADPDAVGVFAGKRPWAPIVLYVKTDDFPGLNLAAIQLDQPGTNDVDVLLAADAGAPGNANRWLMARLFVQAADVSYNQSVNHLGMTHLLEEAFAISTHRQLATSHPLYVLFSMHFAALLVINQLGKVTLLKVGPEGLLNQLLECGVGGKDDEALGASGLISAAYRIWNFDELDFAAQLDKRGMDSASLPYFPYRDDGMLVWDVLGKYARDYVALYYKNDGDVTGDYELQAWANELRTVGNVTSLPAIDRVATLVTVVQRLLWTAGPQHAAVNFPQVDYTTFMPNYPGAPYFMPKRLETDPIDQAQLLACLPPVAGTAVQVQVSYSLAGYHYDRLLDYADQLFPDAKAVCERYFGELNDTVKPEITRRNLQRQGQAGLLAYPYFLPSNIPNSTSV
ncbi:MAG TPA: lipoxygenase family protein [Candidatus Acidoferrum sp.]|nr:lipoxygenase family protein [Candidatus Acidoferrum sp.]